jgi:ribosomal protein S27E
MLWHAIFDFMIPLYNFMNLMNRSDTPDTRRVYVRSDGMRGFDTLTQIFSRYPIEVIDETNPSIVISSGVIGIEKLERNVGLSRSYDESIGFHYNFNRSTALGMREKILDRFGISPVDIGRNGKPLALIIDRGPGSRNMQNLAELKNIMVVGCPHCVVETVFFHHMSMHDQIAICARASVIVGYHGSGLTNTIWMAASTPNHTTHLVEVLPYKYCRDWYHTAADVAGVNYHPVMNKKPTPNVIDEGLIHCWRHPEICTTQACHDKLRDQQTITEPDTFNETWTNIARALTTTLITATATPTINV